MRYVDHDGSLHELACAHCGGAIEVTERRADSTTMACPCGKTSWLYLNMGELDLGIVRDAVAAPSDVTFFGEL